jgi:hypothetical protein
VTTSGSINYSTSSQTIITEALELLGVLGEGQAPTTDQYTSAFRSLNMMAKTWQADGLNLFAIQKIYVFLRLGQPYYDLQATSQDYVTNTFGNRFVDGETLAASTTITLTDASDASIGMNIGIGVGGTHMFWTTITNIVGNVVTLLEPLSDDVSDGAVVYYYLTTANRPMRVLEAYTHRKDGSEIPVGKISRVDYYELSRKDTSGQVVQIYQDIQKDNARVYTWPTTNNEQDYLVLLCQRTLEDFDSLTDSPDYPQEWYMPLVYNLAMYMAPKFGIPSMDYQRLQQQAIQLYQTARGFDAEQEVSLYFKPDSWGLEIGRRGG